MQKVYYGINVKDAVEIPLASVHPDDFKAKGYKIFLASGDAALLENRLCATFKTYDDFLGWQTANERLVWKDKEVASKPKDHINPSHYQGYITTLNEELQWLEAMQYLPRFRNQDSFIAAVELQGRKYWDRNGGKDEEIQELKKGIWYFKFLLARLIKGSPIKVNEINSLIGDMGQGSFIQKDEFIGKLVNFIDNNADTALDGASAERYFNQEERDLIGLHR
jgi:hypothetical protein